MKPLLKITVYKFNLVGTVVLLARKEKRYYNGKCLNIKFSIQPADNNIVIKIIYSAKCHGRLEKLSGRIKDRDKVDVYGKVAALTLSFLFYYL